MAIIPVQKRETPREQVQQREPAFVDKALDRVLKGLQIAQAGYGIYSDYEKIQYENRKAEALEARSIQEQEAKFAEKFRKDPMAVNIEKSYNAANTITEIAKRKNISQPEFATIMFNTVRQAAGGGQISDKDIELFSPDPSITASIKRLYQKAVSGTATQSDVRNYAQLAEMLKKYNVKQMENRAAWLANTEGRRIGNLDYVVNEILQPRSRLTGAGQGVPLSFRKSQGLEGRELKGQTRARTTLNVPTENAPMVKDLLKKYNAGELGPEYTDRRIQQVIEKSGINPNTGKPNLTPGQALYIIRRSIRALQKKKLKEKTTKELTPEQSQTQGLIDSLNK